MKRPARLLPFMAMLSIAGIGLLYAAAWRPQTPWAMVCVTVIGVVGMVLGYLDDQPDSDDDD